MRKFLSRLRALDADQRIVFLRLWLSRLLGVRKDRLRNDPEGIKKVLFICHGNIMRSAFAEALFNELNKDGGRSAFSAGMFAIPGRSADPRARTVAGELGLTLDNHSAQLMSRDSAEQADLICVMDSMNETICLSRFPGARNKVVLLGSFSRDPGESIEIDDPYMGTVDTVRTAFARIERSVNGLLEQLQSGVSR